MLFFRSPFSYDAATLVVTRAVAVFDALAVVAIAVPVDAALNFGGISAVARVVQSQLNALQFPFIGVNKAFPYCWTPN